MQVFCFLTTGAPGRAVPAHLGGFKGSGAPAQPTGHDASAYPADWSSEPGPSSRAKSGFSPGASFTGLGLAFFRLKEASHHTVSVASHARG